VGTDKVNTNLAYRGEWHRPREASYAPCGGKKHTGKNRTLIDPRPDVMDTGTKEMTLVLHVGAAYEMPVAVVVDNEGVRKHFDGGSDGLVNMGKFMFTYEFLQGFLEQLSGSATTFHGYLRCALRGYVMATRGDSSMAGLHRRLCTHLQQMDNHFQGKRSRKLYKAFVNAVFDYITLQVIVVGLAWLSNMVCGGATRGLTGWLLGVQAVEYTADMGCKCPRDPRQRCGHIITTLVYDNACNLYHYILAREPKLARRFRFFVDRFHFKGHQNCSPYMSQGRHSATREMNSSANEQLNR